MTVRYSLFAGVLILAILALQYDLWWSQSGYFAVKKLTKNVAVKNRENEKLAVRNDQWYRTIVGLRSNHSVIEGMARENLGFIKNGETFYQILPPQNTLNSTSKISS